jgi:hypothetical protein
VTPSQAGEIFVMTGSQVRGEEPGVKHHQQEERPKSYKNPGRDVFAKIARALSQPTTYGMGKRLHAGIIGIQAQLCQRFPFLF